MMTADMIESAAPDEPPQPPDGLSRPSRWPVHDAIGDPLWDPTNPKQPFQASDKHLCTLPHLSPPDGLHLLSFDDHHDSGSDQLPPLSVFDDDEEEDEDDLLDSPSPSLLSLPELSHDDPAAGVDSPESPSVRTLCDDEEFSSMLSPKSHGTTLLFDDPLSFEDDDDDMDEPLSPHVPLPSTDSIELPLLLSLQKRFKSEEKRARSLESTLECSPSLASKRLEVRHARKAAKEKCREIESLVKFGLESRGVKEAPPDQTSPIATKKPPPGSLEILVARMWLRRREQACSSRPLTSASSSSACTEMMPVASSSTSKRGMYHTYPGLTTRSIPRRRSSLGLSSFTPQDARVATEEDRIPEPPPKEDVEEDRISEKDNEENSSSELEPETLSWSEPECPPCVVK